MLNFLVGKYTVSDICSALVLGVYDLWYLYFSMDGLMHQPGSICDACDVLYFGLLWITTLSPGVDSGVRL